MAASSIFKFIIKMGKKYIGTNSKNIADDLVRQGGKRTPKTKVPSSANVQKAPSVPNSRTSAGKFTKTQPPARPRTSAPKKLETPKSTSPAKPKADTVPAARPSAKKPSVATTAPKKPARPGDNARTVGGSKSKPSGRDYSMKSRTNAGPPRLSSKPASLRASTLDSVPSVDTSSEKKGTPTKRLDTKGNTPKPSSRVAKKAAPKPASKRPKARPAKTDGGAMTLRKYLNDAIAKRNSTVTEQKKGAEKYGSIAAAKKAGSLYYKNPKSGKIMAAVYKEDLKK